MNINLTESIINHVLCNLKVISSDFINDNSKSIINRDYLLEDKLSLELEDGAIVNNKIWGCQFLIENKTLKVLVCDASIDESIKEYCVMIHLDGSPIYGLYLILDQNDPQPMIACSVNGKEWIKCSTYLEATFLAGMEQIKNHLILPQKCNSYKYEYTSIVSFIEFHTITFEDKYEGKEN